MDTFPSPPESPEPPALQPANAMAPKTRDVEPARNLAFMWFNLFSSLSGNAGNGAPGRADPVPGRLKADFSSADDPERASPLLTPRNRSSGGPRSSTRA